MTSQAKGRNEKQMTFSPLSHSLSLLALSLSNPPFHNKPLLLLHFFLFLLFSLRVLHSHFQFNYSFTLHFAFVARKREGKRDRKRERERDGKEGEGKTGKNENKNAMKKRRLRRGKVLSNESRQGKRREREDLWKGKWIVGYGKGDIL